LKKIGGLQQLAKNLVDKHGIAAYGGNKPDIIAIAAYGGWNKIGHEFDNTKIK